MQHPACYSSFDCMLLRYTASVLCYIFSPATCRDIFIITMSYDGPTPNEVLKERIQGFGPNGPMPRVDPDPTPSSLGDLLWKAVEKMPAELDNMVNQAATQLDQAATSIDDAFEGFINSLEEERGHHQQAYQQQQQMEYRHSSANREELDEKAREARRAQALIEKKEVRGLIEKICVLVHIFSCTVFIYTL